MGVTLASIQAEGTKYTFVDNPKLAFSSLTITGTVVVGKTLTAVPKIVNPNGVSYTYQWYYDGSQKIIGATGPTYKIAASTFGRVISVRVTATKPGHVTATAMSDLTAPVLKGTFAAATAHITGTLRVANVVSASLSTSPTPTRLSYQWYADGSAIRGATSRSYKIAAAWAGSSLRVRIIASASGYVTLSTMSAPTAPVAFGRLVLGTPKLTGVAKVGHTLTAKKGACTSGTKVEYWFTADGNKFDAVQVSTKNTFTIPARLVGKRITVYVSGTRAGYGFSFSAPSKPTKAIVK